MGAVVFSEPDTIIQVQNIVDRFKDRWARWILSLRFFSERLAIAGMLTRLYKKYGYDPMFRDAMESLYRGIMERKNLTPDQLGEFFGARFLPKDIREMMLEDIEEAQEALELKKYLEANEDKVHQFLIQSSTSEG